MPGQPIELASGYVSIGGDTTQLARDLNEAFRRAQNQAGNQGGNAGRSFGSRFGSALKAAGIGVAAGAGLALGSAFTKGFSRLTAIDDAQAKLRGLGHDAKAVQTIMDSALASVKGTAFGLGEAASIAASAVAAGIKPGQELTKYLKLTADAATIAGTDLNEMGRIMNQVTTGGVALTDDLNQLADRGIPIFTWLQEEVKLSGKEFKKFVSDGNVDAATFRRAIEKHIGGAALESGKTFSGSMKNMQAALGRFGATLLGPIFAKGPAVFGALTVGIDKFGNAVGKIPIGSVFNDLFEEANKAANVLGAGNIGEKLTGMFGKVKPVLDDAGNAVRNFATGMGPVFAGSFLALRPFIIELAQTLTDLGQAVLPHLTRAFTDIADAFGYTARFIKENDTLFKGLAFVITVALLPALTIMAALWLKNMIVMGLFYATMGVLRVAMLATTAAQWLLNVALSANPIGLIIGAVAALAAGLWYFFTQTETGRRIWQVTWDFIKSAMAATWAFIKPIWDGMVNGLQVLGGWIMRLWSDYVRPAFNFIGSLISVWWSGVKITFDGFRTGIGAIGDAIMFWWKNVVEPAWNTVGSVISFVVNSVIKPAFDGLKSALGAVGDFFNSTVEGIKSAWNGIKSATAAPINFVINSVWNNGLLKAWNSVAGWLPGLKKAEPLQPVGFRRGGPVSGGTPFVDSVPALLMPNENVWDIGAVKKVGGQGVVEAIKNMVKLGIPFSWDSIRGLSKAPKGVQQGIATAPPGADMAGFLHAIGAPGFRLGGAVRPAWEYQLEHGHKIAKMRDGNPYTWGYEDCSGYLSMIADGIINGGNGVRRWATSSFPGGQPWTRGLGQGFSVFVNDDPGGPGGGHTAGTLSGVGPYGTVNVESGGSHGRVAYGGPAAGADSMPGARPGMFHLAIGADGAFESAGGPSVENQDGFLRRKITDTINKLMDPIRGQLPSPPPEMLGWPRSALDTTVKAAVDGALNVVGGLGSGLRTTFEAAKNVVGGITSVFRDQGGFIPHGLSLVRNETGKPEAVLNWEQLQKVQELISAGKSMAEALAIVTNNPDLPGVVDKAGSTFAQKAGDIVKDSLFEILTPFSGFPNPQSLFDRYTIEAVSSGVAQESQATTVPQKGAQTAINPQREGVAPPPAEDGSYVGDIAKAAKAKGLGLDAAIIGVGTALVESGLKMYANSGVAESLARSHDAVGSDHDSVGLFQQRATWGSVAQRMDAFQSAGLFYNALTQFDWKSMAKGDAAQKVQRSAYPDRYEGRMAEAEELLRGKFDNGGMLPPGLSLFENRQRVYEPVVAFNKAQWATMQDIADGQGGGNGDDFSIQIGTLTVANMSEAQRTLKNMQIRQSMKGRGRP